MVNGRAIIESSTPDGIQYLIESLQIEFHHVSATTPVKTCDGRYISSVRFSNDTTIKEVEPACG